MFVGFLFCVWYLCLINYCYYYYSYYILSGLIGLIVLIALSVYALSLLLNDVYLLFVSYMGYLCTWYWQMFSYMQSFVGTQYGFSTVCHHILNIYFVINLFLTFCRYTVMIIMFLSIVCSICDII